MMSKVLICGKIVWAAKECDRLLGSLAEVVHVEASDRAEFLSRLQPGSPYYDDVVGIYRTNTVADARLGKFDYEVISKLPPSMKWIANSGTGYDEVDVNACRERGIGLSNTPDVVIDTTATTALFLIISTFRRFSYVERTLRETTWKGDYSPSTAHDLTNRTLAILGLGRIGLRLAELVHAFPMRVVYHSSRKVEHAPAWCEYFGGDRLDEMLAQTDVLSVHVPLNPRTEGLVGEEIIRKLKKGAIIVNTARGKVLDEDAVIRALEDGHLGGVGLDVYPNEPQVHPRLLEFQNATLLPHAGADTFDALKNMEVRALTNLRDYLLYGRGADIVAELKD